MNYCLFRQVNDNISFDVKFAKACLAMAEALSAPKGGVKGRPLFLSFLHRRKHSPKIRHAKNHDGIHVCNRTLGAEWGNP
jgi:hypothetical protein